LVSIGDRQADVYDLLAALRPAGVELLIRASWDRCVSALQRYVWATVAAHSVVEQCCFRSRVGVCSRGTRRRWRLPLAPPRHRKSARLPEVTLWAVQGREVAPPAEGQPIEWLLLTTMAVDRVEDARERVHWYACR
jgi:hypothetical protein